MSEPSPTPLSPPPMPAVKVVGAHKSYWLGRTRLHVLRGLSLEVRRGEFVAVVGASGSGKSTLLHLIGLLDAPDRGQLFLDGAEVERLSGRWRNRIRCREIGFVFQFYHLLPELNVLENTLLPAQVDFSVLGWRGVRKACRERAVAILGRLGLTGRLQHKPKELSGGERQRVAIARALMNDPKLLLADEPTGNLDSKTGKTILRVLKEFNRHGQTILMVTHDANIANEADRVLHLRDGRLTEGEPAARADVPQPPPRRAPGALASMVCGLVGLVFAGMLLGVIAVVMAATAKRALRRNPSLYTGSAIAWAGLALGIADLTLGSIAFIWLLSVLGL